MKTKQSKIKKGLYVSFLSIALVAFNACSKDDTGTNPDKPNFSTEEALSFNSEVAKLSGFSQPEELVSPIEIDQSGSERDTDDRTLECFTKTFKASPGYDEMISLDPTTDVIFPGALLKGESIPTGEYIAITANRAPITISASLTNISGSPVVEISDPKLSTVREGIKEILDQEVTGGTPARISFELKQVYSEQQLSAAIGVNYRSTGQSVSSNLSFNSTTKKNKFVLKYLQTYYTLDMDLPDDPSDLFTSLPNLDVLGSTAPVFVSSVAYGRMVLYTIETNSSETEVYAAFDAAFKKPLSETNGSVEAGYVNTIRESTIKALIIGGSGASAANAINGPAEVFEFISEGGDYTRDSPGAPLAYKLRFIKKGTPVARVVLISEYPVRTCDLAYPEYLVTIVNITSGQPSDIELHGDVGIRLKIQGGYLDINNNGIDDGPLWSKNDNNWVAVQNDKTITLNDDYTLKPYRPNMSTDFIEYYGELFDKNIIGSANLGDKTGSIKLDKLEIGIENEVSLDFDDDVTVSYSIQRIK